MKWWRRKWGPLSCQDMVPLVTDYLEGTLSPRARRRVQAHLDACLDCPEYVAQIQAIAKAAAFPLPDAPPLPSDARLIELFRSMRPE